MPAVLLSSFVSLGDNGSDGFLVFKVETSHAFCCGQAELRKSLRHERSRDGIDFSLPFSVARLVVFLVLSFGRPCRLVPLAYFEELPFSGLSEVQNALVLAGILAFRSENAAKVLEVLAIMPNLPFGDARLLRNLLCGEILLHQLDRMIPSLLLVERFRAMGAVDFLVFADHPGNVKWCGVAWESLPPACSSALPRSFHLDITILRVLDVG